MPAKIIQFPALVAEPVKNIRWHGRYPRGVASLWAARNEAQRRARLARMEEIGVAVRGATDGKEPGAIDPWMVAMNAKFLAVMAQNLLADIHGIQLEDDK